MFERVKFPKNSIGHVNFFDLENKEFVSMIKYFVLIYKAYMDKIWVYQRSEHERIKHLYRFFFQ